MLACAGSTCTLKCIVRVSLPVLPSQAERLCECHPSATARVSLERMSNHTRLKRKPQSVRCRVHTRTASSILFFGRAFWSIRFVPRAGRWRSSRPRQNPTATWHADVHTFLMLLKLTRRVDCAVVATAVDKNRTMICRRRPFAGRFESRHRRMNKKKKGNRAPATCRGVMICPSWTEIPWVVASRGM